MFLIETVILPYNTIRKDLKNKNILDWIVAPVCEIGWESRRVYNRDTAQMAYWVKEEKVSSVAATWKRCTPHPSWHRACQDPGAGARLNLPGMDYLWFSLPECMMGFTSWVCAFSRYNKIFNKFPNSNRKKHARLISWDFTISSFSSLYGQACWLHFESNCPFFCSICCCSSLEEDSWCSPIRDFSLCKWLVFLCQFSEIP